MFKLLNSERVPRLKTVFYIVLTILVSSCSCEHSFRVSRGVFKWLRNTMEQERLKHLAVICIETVLLAVIK